MVMDDRVQKKIDIIHTVRGDEQTKRIAVMFSANLYLKTVSNDKKNRICNERELFMILRGVRS
jgi:hypothetical protein